MTDERVVSWEVTAGGGFETAWVELGGRDTGLRARGRAVGSAPGPYWVSYELETAAEFVTRRLHVRVEDADGTRELDLRHDGAGWTAGGEPLPGLGGALDCDLGLCPLTNTMPVLRHRLHEGPGEREFLMAWVSVPDLTVRPSRQRYRHLGRTEAGGAVVRYSSEDFVSDITFDADALVVDYPRLAHRLG
ncbi:putative glycolipid-binding domain-containing protein [Streptomyces antimicrobicus]|uniref:Glycolipid-binding domain-containing protein n=1 Tax=Streptomyces antimicrobicus TaxID=2883108 RepID=A0ABS8B2J9_9ACTN|nr:putative glycolipid-binding domain-containing protein [Streptomyces antimicrobicus]MCB5178822.1 putative glycolipid-binding domain-containing protein [Streptomyces antimicrobicus]